MDLTALLEISEQKRRNRKDVSIRCCTAMGCRSVNSLAVKEALETEVRNAGLEREVEIRSVGCLGLCSKGPLIQMEPDNVLYAEVTPQEVPTLVSALKGGTTHTKRIDLNHPFFARQVRVVLENAGRVDPERIESYIAAGGYQTLFHVLYDLRPHQVIEEVAQSGLRGRGGAGFPTGLKWATVAKAAGNRKFVVCNADEGDPGAFMDRAIMESDPHRVLEGMAIAGYAVGANQGYIYVRGEYPLAYERLSLAVEQATRMGVLGSHVFESLFDFRVDLRVGAGAFVCGEETALMASIEGKRGMPRPRPPFPAESGLWGSPTLLNNVETFANIPPILWRGADWFAAIGTEKSKGTKVFSLAGQIQNTGLIEVPMGTPLRQIVEEMGGGSPGGRRLKAVQTGGSSGGCVPASALDTPVDYESLAALGSIMGSGGMVVLDETTNMVDLARFFMEFGMEESCGKCAPCRVGTVQLQRLLGRFVKQQASEADLARLEELCDLLKNTSLCGLGQNAPNPILSTLRHFREEYVAGIRQPTDFLTQARNEMAHATRV